jgi:hypothetical protein
MIWLILSNFRENQNKESMRTIPRPNPNYDPNEYVTIKNNPRQMQKININDEIDNMIRLYFGRNNIPTKLCIAMYYQYFVNQGNVSIQNKMRLKDFCYYILQYVIPSIPSELNPEPTIDWPYIEFLSNSLKSYTVQSAKTYSPFVMYQVNPYEYDQINLNGGNGLDAPGSNGPGVKNTPGSGSSDSSNSKDSNKNGGNNSSCGCPTACFANLLANMNDPSNNSPGSSSSSSTSSSGTSSTPGSNKSGNSINTPGGYSANNFLADPALFSRTNQDLVSDLRITNEPQTTKPGTLDGDITDFINNYFGVDSNSGIGKPLDDMPIPDQLLPTNFGKVEFSDFFKTRTLIDQSHKTKLYDLVHYFMENIVIGLPTETVPFSYVEWRPIVWSSVSYI